MKKNQTPMFSYTDAQGNRHEVWFEKCPQPEGQNPACLGPWKCKGVALWRLGMEDPAIWTMLRMKGSSRKFYIHP